MNDHIRIREIAAPDWPALAALEHEAYAHLSLAEGEHLLRSRAAASPATCFALTVDGQLAGYTLTLPYPRPHCPDPTRPEHTRHDTTNLHLHDLVVSAPLRRRGLGSRLVRHVTATARERGFETVSLIAVAGKETFWRANGYAPHPETPVPSAYGTDALYMSARLPREALRTS
ncbi:GNAT family N-acetyltransferase [Streptomyces griseofuscus]|uniref:GNAT family N-acetyltransferase n=1 Tax=Streptomyces griseofuscus TaxID=146922 RepID=A0A7H1PWF6_9ACTN|nr:GNAT family N-acetyltransferase [Streptomyces griseofuscus]QNT92386.1 GNAT family N-acetyltransferase [Streptomyces griseofuscus]